MESSPSLSEILKLNFQKHRKPKPKTRKAKPQLEQPPVTAVEVYEPPDKTSNPVLNMDVLQNLLREGYKSEDIAMRFGLSVEVVKPLCSSLKTAGNEKPSTRAVLDRHLEIINNAVEQAQGEYAHTPSDKNAHALTSLIGTSKSLLHDLINLEESYTWAKDVDKLVMRPFMEESLKFLVLEINDFLSLPFLQADKTLEHLFKARIKQMLSSLSEFYRKLYMDKLNALADYCQLSDEDKVKLVPPLKKATDAKIVRTSKS